MDRKAVFFKLLALFTLDADVLICFEYRAPFWSVKISAYIVRTVRLSSGERLPMLSRRDTGLPHHSATLWSLTELRATNLASATVQQGLRAVMVLYIVLDEMCIDLPIRLAQGQLLTLSEVETLTNKSKLKMDAICPREVASSRRNLRNEVGSVDPLTAGIRLRYIRMYLDWLTKEHLLRMGAKHPLFEGLRAVSVMVLGAIDARIPKGSRRLTYAPREGLSPSVLERILEVIQPDSSQNPWKNSHARIRNYLMVRWLLSLGNRRGELLLIKISDIDFRTNEVLVPRRADDPDDPRIQQPHTKTNDRLLALDDDLAELTRQYVMNVRHKFIGARKHEFLWVANGSGAPLSLSGFHKVFITLREKVPGLPESLSAHVLRHTWNDLFSADMDAAGVSEAEEHKMRTRLMGWSDTSVMAAVYTRRHIMKKAKQASLELQAKLSLGNNSNET